ncbi:MAG: hypothetical protein WB715_08685 [Roseiarcus sp.]|uniref:hypothetical protein n=1 Tax=Roseiarcus sp. TaxID=1969460 RepID=UPI003C5E3211
MPDELGGEYSRTIAAAIFVAILFVATMRVQKLYSPNRLMVWDDQARSVLGAWCGAFLILASGVFSWGVSRDLSRGDIILFGAIGIVALLGHRAAWRIALPRALESGALRGRTIVSLTCGRGRAAAIHRQSDPPRLSRGGSLSHAPRRIVRRRGD